MRILHVLSRVRLADGGVVRAVLELCEALAARGHAVTLATGDDADVPGSWPRAPGEAEPTPGLARVVLMPMGRIFSSGELEVPFVETARTNVSRRGLEVWRKLAARHDVMHLHGAWSTGNHQLGRHAEKAGLAYVISPHGMLDEWSMAQRGVKKRLHLALVSRRTFARARAVHFTAEAERRQSVKFVSPRSAHVIPLLMDAQQFATLPGPEAARRKWGHLAGPGPHLLFLSRIHPKKGADRLIPALARLHARGVKATLTIAGPGEEALLAEIDRLAREQGVAGSCHRVGMVGGAEKLSLYQACDLFVLPTSQENFGFVLIESLACGTPVVTTQGVDIWPELVESGAAELSTQAPESIAEAVEASLGKASAARREGARAWALTYIDRGRTIDAYERLYQG
jgi:glycosyltransferase involved in cell wall biosynthesis